MTSLYLHGLNSTHQNDRTEWLSQFGKVVNPPMEYRNYPENYQFLEKLVIDHRPDVIVASSLGGYFAFHLGNYYRIPTILLNPAILMTNIIKPDVRQFVTDTFHTLSIGKNDTIIPPWTTRAVLQQFQSHYQIFEYDMGHETAFEVFVDVCKKSGLFR